MTDKTKQALELALEALENTQFNVSITAIREALAEQPAQQQEPYAWMAIGGTIWRHKTTQDDVPLYTTLPHKPWVGLTDEEIQTLWRSSEHMTVTEVCRSIEAKLKEKNHG